jgi:sugar O-acyltransferase (sialic acid O-acetyltransferase NeuD family)
MSEILEIKIPKENVNDDVVVLYNWNAKNGEKVSGGQIIAEVETAKAVLEIEAIADGYLFYELDEGSEISVGEVLAVITKEKDFSFKLYRDNKKNLKKINNSPQEEIKDIQINISKKALQLIKENNLNENIFYGKGMVTEKDVRDYLNKFKEPDQDEIKPIGSQNLCNQKLLILGGGGHAKMCIDVLKQMKTFQIYGIIDENLEIGSSIMGIPVIGRDEDLQRLFDEGYRLIINGIGAITNHARRESIYEKLKKIGFSLPNIIHPAASVEPSAILGEGNQIMANATVGSDVKIMNNCIVNIGAIISHESILHDNVHVSPGAILAGSVVVNENTLIGMGSTIYLNVKVGKDVLIFNGCNVTKDIRDNEIIKKSLE